MRPGKYSLFQRLWWRNVSGCLLTYHKDFLANTDVSNTRPYPSNPYYDIHQLIAGVYILPRRHSLSSQPIVTTIVISYLRAFLLVIPLRRSNTHSHCRCNHRPPDGIRRPCLQVLARTLEATTHPLRGSLEPIGRYYSSSSKLSTV